MSLLPNRQPVIKGRLGGKPFMYNPSTFSHDLGGADYATLTSPGISYPLFSYVGGKAKNIKFTLYLNARMMDIGDSAGSAIIQSWISFLEEYLPQKSRGRFKPPPDIEFAFGTFVKRCKLLEAPVEQLAFTPSLEPIEVSIEISLLILE